MDNIHEEEEENNDVFFNLKNFLKNFS